MSSFPTSMSGSIGWVATPKPGDLRNIWFGAGTDVAAMSDADGGPLLLMQPTVAARPSYNSTSTLDGYGALSLSFSGASQLSQTTGGVTGANAPHYMWGVFSHQSGNTYCGVGRFGATGSSAVNSFLGDNGASVWAGRGGNGSPAVSDDTAVHLVEKYFDGTQVWVCRDGAVSAAATADAGYNIVSAELGLGGGYSGTADALVYAYGWGRGAVTPIGSADRRNLGRWVRSRFPSLAKNRSVRVYGDSQSAGNGPVYPWPQQLSNMGGLLTSTWDIDYSGAIAGYTTSNILAGTPYQQTGQWGVSGLRPANVAIVWAGTNDLYFGGTAAAAWANLQTICGTLRAAGNYVIVGTTMDRQQSGTPVGYATQQAALNASIRAGYSAIADSLFDVAAMSEFASSTNLIYFQADACHLSQIGHDLFAARMAAILNGTKSS